jgi:hypothetical protein
MTETCSSCLHYFAVRPEVDQTKECHRFPPSVLMVVEKTPTPDNPDAFVVRKFVGFPYVEPDWSCGEWESRYEEPDLGETLIVDAGDGRPDPTVL